MDAPPVLAGVAKLTVALASPATALMLIGAAGAVIPGKVVLVVVDVVVGAVDVDVLVDVVLVDVVGAVVGTTPPKLAVTVLAASMVTTQVAALPVHAPPQVTLSAGVALSVTTVPGV